MCVVVTELSSTDLELDYIQVQFSWQVVLKHMMLTTYCKSGCVPFLVLSRLIHGFKFYQAHPFIILIVSPPAFHLIVLAAFADHCLDPLEEEKKTFSYHLSRIIYFYFIEVFLN